MAQFARPASDVSAGAWTATPLWSKLDEAVASDADFVTSDNNTNGDTFEVALSALTNPDAGTVTLRVRRSKSATGGHALQERFSLYQGASLIQELAQATPDSTAWATVALTITNRAAITDWADLRVRVSREGATGGAGGTRRSLRASWIELETPDAAPPPAITGTGASSVGAPTSAASGVNGDLEPTSRQFDGTDDYARNAAAVKSAPPFTLVAWVKRPAAANTTGTILNLGRLGDDHFYAMWIGSGNEVRGSQNGAWGGTDPTAQASTLLTDDTWEHVAMVFASASDRAIYLNGGSKVTNVQPVTTTTPTTTTVGATSRTAPGSFWTGQIAHAAIYGAALTDQEVADLAGGALPTNVRSADLLAYWPLAGDDSPEPDEAGAFDLTLTGTSKGADGPTMAEPPPDVTGTGASSVPAPGSLMQGAVIIPITGTGASVLAGPTATANGAQILSGSGASAVSAPVSAGAGALRFSGAAASASVAPSTSGSGSMVFSGTAASSLPGPSSAGAGAETFTGAGSSAVVAPTSEASGGFPPVSGTGASLVIAPSAAAVGLMTFTGAGSSASPAPVSSSSGAQGSGGIMASTVAAPSSSGAGGQTFQGSATSATANPTAQGAATVLNPVSGAGASSLVAPTSSGAGTMVGNDAVMASEVPAPSSSGAGGITFIAEMLASVPAPTATMVGGLSYVGQDGQPSVAGPTSTAVGDVSDDINSQPGFIQAGVLTAGARGGARHPGGATGLLKARVRGTVAVIGEHHD